MNSVEPSVQVREPLPDPSHPLDRLIRRSAIALTRRRLFRHLLLGGAAALAIQALGFSAPPAKADHCYFCCGGACSNCCATGPANCCSPNLQYCYGGGSCCCNQPCACSPFKVCLSVCNDGSYSIVCNPCS